MFKTKLLTGILLVIAILFAQVGTVFAAPAAQETTPIVGTITDIQTETDANGVTTVLVTVLDDQGTSQTVRLSVETAAGLGLLVLDPATNQPVLDPVTNEPVVDESKLNQAVEIDPTTVIPDVEGPEEPVHPIAALLASFFGEDPAVVNQYHMDGFGFGVIAQAMWMAQGLEENNPDVTAELILQAKRDKDFSAFVLPDGSSPTNWGQFKKAALGKDKKNLGIIVSGHAENPDGTTDVNTLQEHGNGNNRNNGNGNGNGHGNGNGNRP